ncbi:MAG: hypothetical protein ACYTFZ_11460 [Planctomycetota bacterium]
MDDWDAGVRQGRELARESGELLGAHAADNEALLAHALGPARPAGRRGRLLLHHTRGEQGHLADLGDGLVVVARLDLVDDGLSFSVHRLIFKDRHL